MNVPGAVRSHRRPATLLIGLVAALIAWSPVLGAVTWGTVYRNSPLNAYSLGNALGRTVLSDGTNKFHQVYTQYVIGGEEVTDTGPYLGVYYRRGNASGSTWGTAKRLNSSSAHGDLGVVDTSGKYVYAAWRRQPSSGSTWNGVDPRALQFRRNTNHGSASYWKSQPSFMGADRIDMVSVAASGSRVWIAYTDAVGGEIRLQRSTDYGATFTLLEAVGATTALRDGGFSGRATVLATGSTVAVAWDNGSSTRLKISTNAGSSWAVDTDLDSDRFDRLDGDAASGKVAFAWVEGDHKNLYVRRWNGTALGSTRTIVTLNDATTYKQLSLPAIALSGTSVIGIAYLACSQADCSVDGDSGTAMRWIESRNAGSSWVGHKTIQTWNQTSSRRANEFPSVAWAGSTRRAVSWTSFGSTSDDRILVRVGTGTP